MKQAQFSELVLSFFAVCFYSGMFLLLVLTGIVLMPFFIITIFLRAIFEIYRWKKWQKQ